MIVRKLVLSLGMLALAAGPAAAVESLTGTYTGKLKCNGTLDGVAVKTNESVSVTVLDGGAEGISMNLTENGGGVIFGFTVADTAKPLNGHVTGLTCGELEPPFFGAAVHLDVVTKAAPSTKATMKGSIIRLNEDTGEAVVCTISVKRTSTVEPPGPACLEI